MSNIMYSLIPYKLQTKKNINLGTNQEVHCIIVWFLCGAVAE